MSECWKHCAPRPEQIKEDIPGWERVNLKIIAAKGTMVPDENFRSGRRELRIDGKAGPGRSARRETKARKRDRKDTVAQELVSHPELKEAVEILLGGADSD